MKEIFSKSEKFKQEYCCSVVRIGEMRPIEGSDFLAQTMVDGFSMVIRKDECKEGDIMFYCENETELNHDFLALNNLFELGERELNINYREVAALISNGKTDEAKRKVGFFNKHGRVKMIKLRGCPSMGFLFKLENLVLWDKSLNGINLDEYVGTDFDTINGKEFIKAYVPHIKCGINTHHSGTGKYEKRVKKFNRLVDGEFHFHYDTQPLQKNMSRISPTDSVTISVKMHGTSFIDGNILVRKPIKINKAQKWLNNKQNKKIHAIIKSGKKNIGDLIAKKVKTYNIGYGEVYSSRGVIINQYINEAVSNGFYGVDIWGVYAKILKGLIPEGYTIYGEIVGYLPDSDSMIQKNYDYGCDAGNSKLMIYRVNYKDSEGISHELDVLDVMRWTNGLISSHKELSGKIIPIPVVYNGTLMDLYPEVPIDGYWHDNILEKMKSDKEHFGMEGNETMCKNNVPREGVVLRIDGDNINEAFKLKCANFLLKESKEIDAGNVDIEMGNTEY